MILLTDESIPCPFVINEELISIALNITSGSHKDIKKHIAIFNWINQNISYDINSKLLADSGIRHVYKTSLETYYTRTGNCAEMAFLYIVMARSCSLESSFVLVDVDYKGEEVCHACAMSLDVLIDLAYKRFKVNHREYRVLNDLQTSKLYYQFNGGQIW